MLVFEGPQYTLSRIVCATWRIGLRVVGAIATARACGLTFYLSCDSADFAIELPELTSRLTCLGQAYLAAVHPEFVTTFSEAYKRHPSDLKAARDLVKDMKTPRFAGMARLFTSVHDVELQGLRVKYALRLFGTSVEAETLETLRFNQGAWVDYHYYVWLLAMHGYLERVRKMLLQLERSVGKIAPVGGVSADGNTKQIDVLISRIDGWRNSNAHGGGAVENIAKSGAMREAITLGIWAPVSKDTLRPYEEFQPRWHDAATQFTEGVLVAVQQATRTFVESTDWSALEQAAKSGTLYLPESPGRRPAQSNRVAPTGRRRPNVSPAGRSAEIEPTDLMEG